MSNSKRRVLYICGNITEFDASPINIYRFLGHIGYYISNPTVVALLKLNYLFKLSLINRSKKMYRKIGYNLFIVPRIPIITSIIILIIAIINNTKIIHSINYNSSFHTILLKLFFSIKVVVEIRGVVPEEKVFLGYWRQNGFRYKFSKKLEKQIYKRADTVILVSNSFKRKIFEDYKIKNIVVNPTSVPYINFNIDKVRTQIRNMQGLTDEFVVCYNGSLFNWGDPNLIIYVFNHISSFIKSARLFIFTNSNIGDTTEYFISNGINRNILSVLHISYNMVIKYLCGCDLGLLLRDYSIVNKVASPTKFPEYLSAGLPVIATESIGDVSEIIRTHEVGLVLSEDHNKHKYEIYKFLKEYEKNRIKTRKKCIDIVNKYFSISNNIERCLNIYDDLENIKR